MLPYERTSALDARGLRFGRFAELVAVFGHRGPPELDEHVDELVDGRGAGELHSVATKAAIVRAPSLTCSIMSVGPPIVVDRSERVHVVRDAEARLSL